MSIVKIGVFDSGIGGFSILKELFITLPQADFYYIADEEFHPYGEKSAEDIKTRSCQMVDFLLAKNVQIILVACNTATAVAIAFLREKYSVPFVGVEPYLNILNQKNLLPEDANIAAIMTKKTYTSEKFLQLKKEKDPMGKIHYYPLAKLASLIENNSENFDDENFIAEVERELQVIDRAHTHLILGCTHYPLIEGLIKKILRMTIISPCKRVASRVIDLVDQSKKAVPSQYFHFYSSRKKYWESKNRTI